MRTAFIILISLLSFPCVARTIICGPGQAVTTLKQAIELSKNGDSIIVKAGIYKEGNLIVTKSITIIGEKNCVLDGQQKTELITISAQKVVIKNIHFRKSGYSALNDFASVKVIDAGTVILEGNRIDDAYFAIHVSNTNSCTIRNNTITGSSKLEQLSGNGIHLWKCQQALIENNRITGHRDGIYFEFVTNSTIRNNHSEQNIRYGLHFMFSHNNTYTKNTFKNNGAGVAVMYSKGVTMEENHFEENWGPSAYGILLKEITDSRIKKNIFLKNTSGIYMEGSSRMIIENNEFINNGWAIKVQASCDDNQFLRNNFKTNSFDVATNGTMVLNKFSHNYWDKYEGYDINKDGIGDIPYHPVSMYAMVVEQNPNTLILLRSFIVSLLDKAEKAIPTLTPENLVDEKPVLKPYKQ